MKAVAAQLDNCCGCQQCNVCGVDAISYDGEMKVVINADNCVGCGACVGTCPCGVLEMQ
ncbi:4Fe-4S_dicluster domain-containing protein [Hexamita inflata]|uniref:4Fe-4S dicluster domain-containing protein n=1 Tax=Hexamita inflata TaxID=28002 RepID=A0AA86QE72_9EUKA|nr:4Fe-4S dicluster domain-containing protein [Hexamita inflata]CAI9957586.1 4Fe-4S dicluster domain-containing protein [Hexamita inflata]